jgi:hypothetical protein
MSDSPLNGFLDSYDHYRNKVGLGFLNSIYRSLFYEIVGREPKKYLPRG